MWQLLNVVLYLSPNGILHLRSVTSEEPRACSHLDKVCATLPRRHPNSASGAAVLNHAPHSSP